MGELDPRGREGLGGGAGKAMMLESGRWLSSLHAGETL